MKTATASQDVREALTALAKSGGGVLLPEAVVEAARDKDSPLHSHFDWNNTEAAAKWRLHQARNLIRVVVEYLPSAPSIPQRVFVALRSESQTGGGYRPLRQVMASVDMRADLLSQAFDDMKMFAAKYQHLSELAGVVTAMSSALKKN